MKVLILDEHVSLGARLSDTLRRQGYAPFYCKGGGAALTVLRMQPFDVVLLSDGLRRPSGPEVATELRRLRPGARIIVVSEAVSAPIRARYLALGVTDFVGRHQVHALLKALRRPMLGEKRPATADPRIGGHVAG